MASPHPHDAYVDGSALLAIAFDEVLRVRYLRSGDLLHVATALYHVRNSGVALAFISLDNNPREVAHGLGFAT